MNPISNIDFIFGRLKPIQPTEGVGAEGGARKVQPAGEQGYNPFGAISKIDRELFPAIGGGTHITGLGPANDTGKLKPFLA